MSTKDLTNDQIFTTIEAFSKSASQYAESVERDPYIRETTRAVLYYPIRSYLDYRFKGIVVDKPVAVLGCGTGRDTLRFVRDGFMVDSFDISKEMVNEAKRRVRSKLAKFVVADIVTHDFKSNAYSVVFCDSVLCYLKRKDVSVTLSKIHKMLVKNGIASFSFKIINGSEMVNDNFLFGHKRYFKIYPKITILAFMQGAGFSVISTSENIDTRNTGVVWYNLLVEKI